jgi:hypothetical protein
MLRRRWAGHLGHLGPCWDEKTLFVELWASPSEIRIKSYDDFYVAGLRGFYDSIDELEKNFHENGINISWYKHIDTEDGREIARAEPPAIVEFLIWLVTSGSGAVAIYKILDLWVKKVNGRKIKIKFDGVEIETTQLTLKQAETLLKRITEHKSKELEMRTRELTKDAFSDYPVKDTGEFEIEQNRERGRLSTIYWQTKEKIYELYEQRKNQNQNEERPPKI